MKVKRIDRPPAEPRPDPRPEALFAWGRSNREEGADGSKVAGHRIVRGSDGALYAVREPDDEPPEAA